MAPILENSGRGPFDWETLECPTDSGTMLEADDLAAGGGNFCSCRPERTCYSCCTRTTRMWLEPTAGGHGAATTKFWFGTK